MDTIIEDIEILGLKESKFIRPYRLGYKMDGVKRYWDCVHVHSSVSVLLYHEEQDAFLLVKQFRPAVWYNLQKEGEKYEDMGYTYELCAGLMDKGLSEEETIKEEAIEEVGFRLDQVEKIAVTHGALGFGGNKQTMFFAKINESMRVSKGGGIDGEKIESVYIKISHAREFMRDEKKVKAPGLLFAFMWFFDKFSK
ncbi:NUDIX hydrolase [Campylobacter sp. RM16188]|uniref:NUDIX domain-containing protein n=1 Tax=Campylobacter sp. RM16188 TaxID=1705725 RepID=UPI001557394E|nr:NUDIX hydrolase [Campylobacter sp. RM16188]